MLFDPLAQQLKTVERMSSSSAWVETCRLLAPVAAIVVCLSPLPTIQRIQGEGKVRNLPLLPYSTMIINSLLWSSYGLLQNDPRIWSCNGLGLFLGIGYFYVFAQYAKGASNLPGTVLQHQQLCAVSAVVTVFLWTQSAVNVIGRIGLVFNIILFASPLAALRTVLETRSARSIPLPFTIACIVNCYLWFVNPDPNIYTPNGIGLLLSLIQLALKLYFGDGKIAKNEGLPLRSASSDSSM